VASENFSPSLKNLFRLHKRSFSARLSIPGASAEQLYVRVSRVKNEQKEELAEPGAEKRSIERRSTLQPLTG
jgi:hypothetical protein